MGQLMVWLVSGLLPINSSLRYLARSMTALLGIPTFILFRDFGPVSFSDVESFLVCLGLCVLFLVCWCISDHHMHLDNSESYKGLAGKINRRRGYLAL